MGNTKLKYNKKLNRKVKIYYENIKGNDGKIVNHKKLSEKIIFTEVYLYRGLVTYHTYLHTNRTCQRINMFI